MTTWRRGRRQRRRPARRPQPTRRGLVCLWFPLRIARRQPKKNKKKKKQERQGSSPDRSLMRRVRAVRLDLDLHRLLQQPRHHHHRRRRRAGTSPSYCRRTGHVLAKSARSGRMYRTRTMSPIAAPASCSAAAMWRMPLLRLLRLLRHIGRDHLCLVVVAARPGWWSRLVARRLEGGCGEEHVLYTSYIHTLCTPRQRQSLRPPRLWSSLSAPRRRCRS